ncbi:hypothetical protein KC359_g11 [Hortaea werneckii]|nr:hypothetical protein KC359_g11 [Hortaea werneckii]
MANGGLYPWNERHAEFDDDKAGTHGIFRNCAFHWAAVFEPVFGHQPVGGGSSGKPDCANCPSSDRELQSRW